MKTKLIIILSLFFSLASFAQKPLPEDGFTDKNEATNKTVNGIKKGKWIQYIGIWGDTITNTKEAFGYGLIEYKLNKPIGVVRYYFTSDTITGTNRGKFVYAVPAIDLTDVRMVIYYDNGKLHSEAMYANGKKDGVEKKFFADGKLQEIIPYTGGKMNGTDKTYYENGNLSDEIPYVNDTVTGISKSYSERGLLLSEVPYSHDKINGVLREYDTSGVLTKEVPFVNGKKNGVLKMYYFFSGKLQFEIPYTDDKISGTTKHYDEKGNRIE
jgi:antitoxin component YwqK of YwqJK toxin-antitoxin module